MGAVAPDGMRARFSGHCLEIWIVHVEFSHCIEIGMPKPFPYLDAKNLAQLF